MKCRIPQSGIEEKDLQIVEKFCIINLLPQEKEKRHEGKIYPLY